MRGGRAAPHLLECSGIISLNARSYYASNV
jgi:hypothetical protein